MDEVLTRYRENSPMENVTSFGESSGSSQMESRISCAFSAGEMESSSFSSSHKRHAFMTLLYKKMSTRNVHCCHSEKRVISITRNHLREENAPGLNSDDPDLCSSISFSNSAAPF